MTKKEAIKWFIKKITNDKVKLIHGEDDDWAIEWLQNKKNRKLARKFEGKFFGGK